MLYIFASFDVGSSFSAPFYFSNFFVFIFFIFQFVLSFLCVIRNKNIIKTYCNWVIGYYMSVHQKFTSDVYHIMLMLHTQELQPDINTDCNSVIRNEFDAPSPIASHSFGGKSHFVFIKQSKSTNSFFTVVKCSILPIWFCLSEWQQGHKFIQPHAHPTYPPISVHNLFLPITLPINALRNQTLEKFRKLNTVTLLI